MVAQVTAGDLVQECGPAPPTPRDSPGSFSRKAQALPASCAGSRTLRSRPTCPATEVTEPALFDAASVRAQIDEFVAAWNAAEVTGLSAGLADEATAVGGGRRTGDERKVVRDLQEGSRRPLADLALDVEPALRADGGDVTPR